MFIRDTFSSQYERCFKHRTFSPILAVGLFLKIIALTERILITVLRAVVRSYRPG